MAGMFGAAMSQMSVPRICRITTRRGSGAELDGSNVCLIVTRWGFVAVGARPPVQPSLTTLGG